MTREEVQAIYRAIRPLVPREFTGQIEVNVFQGGISNINIKQSYKNDKEAACNSR